MSLYLTQRDHKQRNVESIISNYLNCLKHRKYTNYWRFVKPRFNAMYIIM